jgi:hypothetical protein
VLRLRARQQHTNGKPVTRCLDNHSPVCNLQTNVRLCHVLYSFLPRNHASSCPAIACAVLYHVIRLTLAVLHRNGGTRLTLAVLHRSGGVKPGYLPSNRGRTHDLLWISCPEADCDCGCPAHRNGLGLTLARLTLDFLPRCGGTTYSDFLPEAVCDC